MAAILFATYSSGLFAIYVHHYALLVCAMHILLQESIDSSLLDAAEMMPKDILYSFLNFMENLIAQPMHTCCYIYLNTLDCGAPLDTISFWVRKQKWRFKTQYPRQEHNTSTVLLHNMDTSVTLKLLKSKVLLQESTMTIAFTKRQASHAKTCNTFS